MRKSLCCDNRARTCILPPIWAEVALFQGLDQLKSKFIVLYHIVRARGLEPLRLSAPAPKAGVSTIPPRSQRRILQSLQL